jgi:hypothetical protein
VTSKESPGDWMMVAGEAPPEGSCDSPVLARHPAQDSPMKTTRKVSENFVGRCLEKPHALQKPHALLRISYASRCPRGHNSI